MGRHTDRDPVFKGCRGWRHIKAQHQIEVKEIKATRAVYLSEDVQRIEVQIESTAGDKFLLVISDRKSADLIMQMESAYLAINPPLRNGNGPASWKGMS